MVNKTFKKYKKIEKRLPNFQDHFFIHKTILDKKKTQLTVTHGIWNLKDKKYF